MKTKIEKLIKYYGSKKNVADVLGVTERHVRGILADTSICGKPLQILIDKILKDIKIKELMNGDD